MPITNAWLMFAVWGFSTGHSGAGWFAVAWIALSALMYALDDSPAARLSRYMNR